MKNEIIPTVVKITKLQGEKTDDNTWHFVFHDGDAETALCTGQVFRQGDEDAEYKTRVGFITCPDCIEIIKNFKLVKL